MTPTDARVFLGRFAGDPLEALMHFALATGARQGKLLGMRWSDIDLGARAGWIDHGMDLVTRSRMGNRCLARR